MPRCAFRDRPDPLTQIESLEALVSRRIIDRLALYYERGTTSRRAALETGELISYVRDLWRHFRTRGLTRRQRRIRQVDFHHWPKPAAYLGPDWIGEAIGTPPVAQGPGWIGHRCEPPKPPDVPSAGSLSTAAGAPIVEM